MISVIAHMALGIKLDDNGQGALRGACGASAAAEAAPEPLRPPAHRCRQKSVQDHPNDVL